MRKERFILRELNEGPLPLTEGSLKVVDLIQNQAWNWNLISFDLQQAIKDSIRATPLQIFNQGEDSIIWAESKDGEFSTNSAYRLANSEQPSVNSFQGSWIWKIDMLPKIVHFMWLCHHNSIPVRGVLASRGISCCTQCPVCNDQEETIIHTLRDCNFARMFWDKTVCHLYSDIPSMRVYVTGSKLTVKAVLSITLLYRGVHCFLLRSSFFGSTGTRFVLKILPSILSSIRHVSVRLWSTFTKWQKSGAKI